MKRHVVMFLIFLALNTLGIALTNFSLTSWVHDEKVGEEREYTNMYEYTRA